MTGSLEQMKRIVVKIGSALLVDAESQTLNRTWLHALGDDLARLRGRGQEVIVVSSGAIALGRNLLGLSAGTLRLEESQAAAAVGQVSLAHAYQSVLAERGITAAQVLLTLRDTEQRRRYLNARNTVSALLRLGALPVINENDTVATSEIRYGDNDRLAARVAGMVSADCLVLLSDVDGLHRGSPAKNPDAELIADVHAITPEIVALAGDSDTMVGSGGMATKIEAARIVLGAGCQMVITRGSVLHPLSRLEDGALRTWFHAGASPMAARKSWIAGALEPDGTLTIDDGAARALASGKSLLPAGVSQVSGNFTRGDAVRICALDGAELARGLIAYDSRDAAHIIGHKSREIEAILGYRGRDEIIHRDDLVLTGGE